MANQRSTCDVCGHRTRKAKHQITRRRRKVRVCVDCAAAIAALPVFPDLRTPEESDTQQLPLPIFTRDVWDVSDPVVTVMCVGPV